MRGFRATYELTLENGEQLFAFHGAPASNTAELLSTTEPGLVEEWLGDTTSSLLAGGTPHV